MGVVSHRILLGRQRNEYSDVKRGKNHPETRHIPVDPTESIRSCQIKVYPKWVKLTVQPWPRQPTPEPKGETPEWCTDLTRRVSSNQSPIIPKNVPRTDMGRTFSSLMVWKTSEFEPWPGSNEGNVRRPILLSVSVGFEFLCHLCPRTCGRSHPETSGGFVGGWLQYYYDLKGEGWQSLEKRKVWC